MKKGDLVGILENDGSIGCPILKVIDVNDDGFVLEWPEIGRTPRQAHGTGGWAVIENHEIGERFNCGCYRCTSPLIELAITAA